MTRVATLAEKNEYQLLSVELDTLLGENRSQPLSAYERQRCDFLEKRVDELAKLSAGRVTRPWGPGDMGDRSPRPGEWLNPSTGQPVHVLTSSQKLVDLPRDGAAADPHNLSLGRFLLGAVTGNWKRAEAERLAMSESVDVTGGVTVPIEIAAGVLDYARAKSVVIQAGARTVPMESDRMLIARVKADPTMQVKGENEAFTEREINFDSVGFTAHTIGCMVAMSRELAEDAVNMSDIIEQTIARALAAELDRLALVGTGSSEPTGLLNFAGIGSTGSVGAIAWEDLLTALTAIETANHTPTAWIVSPTIKGDLAALTSGDGTNSAKLWLPAPPDVAALNRFVTSNCPNANIFMGDFTQMLFAVRGGPRVEATVTGGDSFAKHQVLVKITWRGDFAVEHPGAFHALTGITT